MKLLPILALAALAGCSADAYTRGQTFCSRASAAGPLIVALADQNGAPMTVTNQTAANVAAACALWDIAAKPVPPPTTTVPTVAISAPIIIPK